MTMPAIGHAQDIGARESQQDAFAFAGDGNAAFAERWGVLAVVCDGMGGMENGAEASRAAAAAFREGYLANGRDESIPDALLRCALAAHEAVAVLGTGSGEVGTTLAAVVIRGAELHWIAAGDSPVLLYREGELTLVNRPHAYSAELDRRMQAGEITRERARNDPQREALASYLGASETPRFDRSVRAFPLEEDDCVLVASDGLTRTLDEAAIRAAMTGTMSRRCARLVRAALERRNPVQDNVTVLAIAPREGTAMPEIVPETGQMPALGARTARTGRGAYRLAVLAMAAAALAAGYLLYHRGTPGGSALPMEKPAAAPAPETVRPGESPEQKEPDLLEPVP